MVFNPILGQPRVFAKIKITVAENIPQRNNEGVGRLVSRYVKELHGRGRHILGTGNAFRVLIPIAPALTVDIHIGARRRIPGAALADLTQRTWRSHPVERFIRPKLGKDQAALISFNQYHPFCPGKRSIEAP